MMWIPLRSAKMYGFIFGFQRRVWWPKWTPASSSWRMETVGTGVDLLFGSRPPRDLVAGDRTRRSGTAPVGMAARVCSATLAGDDPGAPSASRAGV